MKTYKSRVFDEIIRDALDAKGAVLIEGAKWCGKTTTAEQAAIETARNQIDFSATFF